jgi:putative endonuclease
VWYIYVVECSDSSLYCGITKDVESRVVKHNTGKGAKYTRARKPVKLVGFSKVSDSKSMALKAEIAFKRLSKKKKNIYISRGLDSFLSSIQG